MLRNQNYHQLRAIVDDINKLKKSNPGIAFLLRERIDRFESHNAIRIRRCLELVNDTAAEFAEKNADGTVKIEDGKYVFSDDAAKDAHAKKYNEVMMATVFDII